ncbi:ribosome biogenesis GTPase YlqF [Clostridium tarantellae]|uniref:Ribosome biogenesis GTPase A n=1 Tax=Clostridium tarantellae TaxID=39493 RepID=A0A6I1MHQ0_9CLOT|nr:ribosome biogenesis GTPase YlqF [Clostridium tarantellae]MPQ42394.1 ribosome biogenesis GTPase YlqF [Clostridium tarantellae]
MAINWFPGHMVKTKREIKENLKLVDAVVEIRDARIVKSSKNPDIDELCAGKPRIILLNKSDLTDAKITKAWKKYLTNENTTVIEVNALKGEGLKNIKPALLSLLKEKHDRLKAKGLVKITTRVMVVGIPNVGKSTFINKMAKNNIAKTGDRPGVTKSKQWIKTSIGIELMDTPGVLWPKFEDDTVALNLAFTGAIKDEIMDTEELALNLVARLQETNPELLMKRYKLTELKEEPIDNLDAIARKRGALISGGQIDYNRIAAILLDEFRGGKIGNISLEEPPNIEEV